MDVHGDIFCKKVFDDLNFLFYLRRNFKMPNLQQNIIQHYSRKFANKNFIIAMNFVLYYSREFLRKYLSSYTAVFLYV